MDILYHDEDIVVCIKPERILSTDEPGGLPDCLRQHFQLPDGDFRTVHRLDRVVGGIMVVARNAESASSLSAQIRTGSFHKQYLAAIHGVPERENDTFIDLLGRDKARKMTFVAPEPGKGIQEAKLDYQLLDSTDGSSLVKIQLHTGRTHQIRVQFASRGMPLIGERKYSLLSDTCGIGLWSYRIEFIHPRTGKRMVFCQNPPFVSPWNLFGSFGH